MKILLLSDLHTEFWKIPDSEKRHELITRFMPEADVAVLAGDIAMGRTNVTKILNLYAKYYEAVVYVPGNHEYYGGLALTDFDSVFESRLPNNVYMLNPGTVMLGSVTFIGAALWTNFGEDIASEMAAKKYITDFRRIKDISIQQVKDAFYQHSGYIKHMYEETPGKKVIVTHFLPALECISPQYQDRDGTTSLLNRYFANDLGPWIEMLEDTTWLFGHTHDAVDVTIGTTRLIANPLGYPNERNIFNPLVLEV